MAKRDYSGIVHLESGDKALAMMIHGTSDSRFILVRGVPSNKESRIDEYLWADVKQNGQPVVLSVEQNPVVIDIPGTYRFRNEGFEDEQALIDLTVYGRKLEKQSYV